MEAIIIKADKESSRLLKQLAKKLGASVADVKPEQYEDFLLGLMMDKEKTGKKVSRESVFKKLGK